MTSFLEICDECGMVNAEKRLKYAVLRGFDDFVQSIKASIWYLVTWLILHKHPKRRSEVQAQVTLT
jgi:hypothetical protein